MKHTWNVLLIYKEGEFETFSITVQLYTEAVGCWVSGVISSRLKCFSSSSSRWLVRLRMPAAVTREDGSRLEPRGIDTDIKALAWMKMMIVSIIITWWFHHHHHHRHVFGGSANKSYFTRLHFPPNLGDLWEGLRIIFWQKNCSFFIGPNSDHCLALSVTKGRSWREKVAFKWNSAK